MNSASGESNPSSRRAALVGRVKMARAMEMTESEWAGLFRSIDEDPLIAELSSGSNPIIRREPFEGSAGCDGTDGSSAPSQGEVIGSVVMAGDTLSVSFSFPHLARGLYIIDRERLKAWQAEHKLDRDTAAQLRKLLGLIDLANMKQASFWRVIRHLLSLHKPFFDTQDISHLAPVSLRRVARQLNFSPSTVCRLTAGKSLRTPWGDTLPMSDLMPGQRRVVVAILEKILPGLSSESDRAISGILRDVHGVVVSRRTVTACRHLIESRIPRQNAA